MNAEPRIGTFAVADAHGRIRAIIGGTADRAARNAAPGELIHKVAPHVRPDTHVIVEGIAVDVPTTPIVKTPTQILTALRVRRNAALAASDWTQLPDNRVRLGENAQAWDAYRGAWRQAVTDAKAGLTPTIPSPPYQTETPS